MLRGDHAGREPAGGSTADDDDLFDCLDHGVMEVQRRGDVNWGPWLTSPAFLYDYIRKRTPSAYRRPYAKTSSIWLSKRPWVLNVSSVTLSASKYAFSCSVNW